MRVRSLASLSAGLARWWWWASTGRPVADWARTNGALIGNRKPQKLNDEDALTAAIIELACKYGRYGNRRITVLLRRDGRKFRMLTVRRGVPDHIRSDNGLEFAARAAKDWTAKVGAQTLFIEPGSPWENGYMAGRILGKSKLQLS